MAEINSNSNMHFKYLELKLLATLFEVAVSLSNQLASTSGINFIPGGVYLTFGPWFQDPVAT